MHIPPDIRFLRSARVESIGTLADLYLSVNRYVLAGRRVLSVREQEKQKSVSLKEKSDLVGLHFLYDL